MSEALDLEVIFLGRALDICQIFRDLVYRNDNVALIEELCLRLNGLKEGASRCPCVFLLRRGISNENIHSTRIENNGGTAEAVSSVTPCGYDAYMAAVNAIEKAGSTEGTAIRDALAALEVKGLVTGDLKFDENGDAVKNYAVIKTIKDGQIVYYSTYNG